MKVWWVLAGDNYYPTIDNFVASFFTEEEANEYAKNEKLANDKFDWYCIVNISERL